MYKRTLRDVKKLIIRLKKQSIQYLEIKKTEVMTSKQLRKPLQYKRTKREHRSISKDT